jgi:CheY-like chemotaxis protein
MFPNVLVVDDNPVDRRLVGGLLSEDQFIEVEYADDGQQALKHIETDVPQLVLTDLMMPNMDGLDFVRALQKVRPSLPIVLMTAFGSGKVAIEALRSGAASYIPKSQLADRLLATVHRLLGMSREVTNTERLTEYQARLRYEYILPNKPALIDAILGLVHTSTAAIHLGISGERLQMGVALEQALLNAIYRGNLEISHDEMDAVRNQGAGAVGELVWRRNHNPVYADRRVELTLDMTRDRAVFVVRDQGPGFDTSIVPKRGDPKELDRESRQGLVLMTNLMDEVQFNDVGNEVVMIKYGRSECV